jgi:cyclopropane-fatty-acyl-phospholipid synthase
MTAKSRLDAVRRLLTHAHERLDLAFGFKLWDGSTIPENLPKDALMIRLADEAMIAALLRKPNIDTLANLWVSARLDILNGSIFDLVARRPAIRTKALLRSLDKKDVVTTLMRFLFLSRGGGHSRWNRCGVTRR